MPVPSSVRVKLNAILERESLGNGWVDARKVLGAGNLVNRVNIAVAGATFSG